MVEGSDEGADVSAEWGLFCPAVVLTGYGVRVLLGVVERVACSCCVRKALARRRDSSMRRTCSGVVFMAAFGPAEGGVEGRTFCAMMYRGVAGV